MTKQQRAYLLALIAILFWSTAGSAFKLTLEHISSYQLVFFATFFSLVFLAIWKVAEGNLIACFKASRNEWIRSLIMGMLVPLAYYTLLFEAYDLLLAQEAVALNYIWPVTLVLFSIPVLKQRISIWSFLALLVSFSGLLVIIFKGSIWQTEFSSPRGIILALMSSVYWAVYWLLNMKDKRDGVSKLFLNFFIGFFCIVIAHFFIPWDNVGSLGPGKELVFSWEGIAGSLYVGIFEMGLTYVLWLKALQLSSTTAKVSNLVYISPFLSLMFVSIAVGETIYLYTIAGLALIVGGIVLQRLVK